MLRRFRVGSRPTRIPTAEADQDVALPSIVEDVSAVQAAGDIQAPAEPAGRARRWLTSALVGVAVAMLAATVVGRRVLAPGAVPFGSAGALPTAVAAPNVSETPPAVSSAVSVPVVTLRIETTPPGAKVVAAGTPVGETPVELHVERGSKPIVVTLRRKGFAPRTERLVPNMSQRLLLALTPLRRAVPAQPKRIPKFR